jgi:glutathione S-transferase
VVFWQTLRLPENKRDPHRIKEESAKTVASLAIFASALAGRSYIAAGKFTLADLVMAPVVYRMIGLSLLSIEKEEWKPLADWYARVQKDPSFQKWVAKPLS